MSLARWLIGCALVLVSLSATPAQDGAEAACKDGKAACGGQITLKLKTHRNWKLDLPQETFAPVGTAFRFKAALGRDFVVRPEGTALVVDTDGDGRPDTRAEGASALLTLEGTGTRYPVRLVNQAGWRFAAAGSMVGRIGDTKIQLIDQDNNGSYADIGKDALIVGRGKRASFLSKVINVGGALYSIDVAKDGSSLRYTPYEGVTGTLDLVDCDTKAKVLGLVVKSLDGQLSFELSRGAAGLKVPAATYVMHSGEMGLGETRVRMRTGRSKPIAVPEKAAAAVSWGGPVRAEFAYARQGGKVQLSPDHIWYFGARGEEYYGWFPNGKSPTITIKNHKTGREIAQAYFPGSC